MKLYLAGMLSYRNPIFGLFAAENEDEARIKAEEKLNLRALPVEVREISEVDGFSIALVGGDVVGESKDEKSGEVERGRISEISRGKAGGRQKPRA